MSGKDEFIAHRMLDIQYLLRKIDNRMNMPQSYMSMENLRHLLFEVHELERLFQYDFFQDHDQESVLMFLDSVKDFSDQDLAPYFREMDAQPAHFDGKKIVIHPHFETIIKKAGELGLIGSTFSYDHGGMQLPETFMTAAYFIMETANNNVPGYLGLTGGAADLIATFGDQTLQDTYLPSMMSGEWGGTMCLTEPQAGSSLSDIVTTAYPAGEGYYHLKGQKIFISGGDHDYVDNMVHLVLARIDGAPAGTRGISLFVAPKYRFDENGALVPNDVTTAGDFQKMGQRGYCTTHLIFGEGDDCRGWLVGKPHQGLPYMFQMMNGARIAVGRGGVAIATAAYYASLAYARERPQGRRLNRAGEKDLSKGQTLIINHPDVRRMLLLQKAVAEGALSLLVQTALYLDLEKVSEGEDREKYNLLVEILTPVVKTYPSEMGRIAVSNGLQILGGYGFCSEYILQQYYRDIRIMAIYEGTTGIQSLDLLGRKVTLHGGKALKLLAAEMQVTIAGAHSHDELKPYARQLGEKLQLTQQVLDHLLGFATQGDYERFLSDATVFMEFFSTIVIAWQWLKVAVHAKEALLTGQSGHTADFYESKIHTMRFFFKYEMPKTIGLAQTLLNEEVLTLAEKRELIL